MAEKLLSSKTAAEKKSDLAAVSKATGNKSYTGAPSQNVLTIGPNGQLNYGTSQPAGGAVYNPGTSSWSNVQESGRPADATNKGDRMFSTSQSSQNPGVSSNGSLGNNPPKSTSSAPVPTAGGVDGSAPINPMSPAASQPTTPQKTPGAATTTTEQQMTTTAPQTTNASIKAPSAFREQALNSVGKSFYSTLGAHENYVKQKIADFEAASGKQVAINSRAFQSQLKSTLGDQNQWGTIFRRFAHSPDYFTTSTPDESSKSRTQATITGVTVDASQTVEDQIATVLNDMGSDTLHSQLSQLLSMPPETPGETLIRNSLMLTLGAIDQTDANVLLDRQEARAIAAYKAGLAMVDAENSEIDKAIDGLLDTPTTTEGLMAKVYEEGKEEQLREINLQKSYTSQRNQIILNDMRSKRADLVGYTKAKLYSMGAEDSSAGVSLLGKIVAEADMQITLAQLDNNYAMQQLDTAARTTISDFTNNVAKLVLDQQAEESTLEGTYNETLNTIDENRFTNEQEKRKLTLEAYADYTNKILDYRTKQEEMRQTELNNAYDRMSQARDDAYKMSGLTGTIYLAGDNGEMVDTGITTFEAKKYQNETWLDIMREETEASTERRQAADLLISQYGSEAAPYVEQLMGLPTGSLDGLQTADELQRALDILKTNNTAKAGAKQEGWDKSNGAALQTYLDNGGGLKPSGIGIDPFTLPDVRAQIQQLSSVTQGWKAAGTGGTDANGGHGGVDYVSKDGYSRSLRSGTVVEVIPWNGSSAWGNQVRIMDDTGVVWQYSHLGNRDVEGDYPFNVQAGQRIEAGEVIGREGNTGRIITSKKGNLAGRHTDVRIVGKMDTPEDVGVEQTEAETKEEKEAAKIVGTAENWLAPLTPAIIQGLAPEMFADKPLSYEDLEGKYVKLFRTVPSTADKSMLQKYGLEGLQMIIGREEDKKKKTTGLTLTSDNG